MSDGRSENILASINCRLAWLLARTVAALPLSIIEFLANLISLIMAAIARKESRQLFANVKAVYGIPAHSAFARQFRRQVFRSQLLINMESIKEILRPGSLKILPSSELQAALMRAEAANKGHLLITAHLGSWELCGQEGMRFSNRKLYPLAKPPKQPGMLRFLDELRSHMKVGVLWTDSPGLFREMIRLVRQGHGIGLVMDQKPNKSSPAPIVSCMGIPTPFVVGPAALKIATGAAVISIFVVRTGQATYRVVGRELFSAHEKGESPEHDEFYYTQAMAAEIERVVRLYPEQWAWNYKRWRFDRALPADENNSHTRAESIVTT